MRFLEDNILKDFLYSDEPFAIINNRLYTFSRIDESLKDNYLSINNQKIKLEESEDISELEKKILDNNSLDINRFSINYIKQKYNGIIDSNFNEIMNIKKDIEKVSCNNSMRNFFLNYVLKDSSNNNKSNVIVPNLSDIEMKKNDMLKLNFSNIDLTSNYFKKNEFLDGVLVFDSNYYILLSDKKASSDIISKGEFIVYNNKKRYLSNQNEFSKLLLNYNNLLKQSFIEKIDNKTHEIKDLLLKLDQSKKDLLKLKNQSDEKDLFIDDMGLKKIKENEYMIIKKIKPFILGVKNNYYYYPEGGIYITVEKSNKHIKFKEPAVLKEYLPYNHPFVFSSGTICFGNYDWKNVGINFGNDYSINNIKEVGDKISAALYYTENSFYYGYRKLSLTPADPNWEKTKIADNKKDALLIAKKKNIKEDRIFQSLK
jgi:hypothetical protein